MAALDPLEIRSSIEELLSRYCRIVDCKDYDSLPEVFAPEVTIRVVIQDLQFHGIDPFKEFLNKTRQFSEDRMHLTSNLSLRIAEKEVRAFCYWQSTMTFKGIPIEEAGYYEMTSSIENEPLRFASFNIYHKYRVVSNVKSRKEVGFPGVEPKISEDNRIFRNLKDWF